MDSFEKSLWLYFKSNDCNKKAKEVKRVKQEAENFIERLYEEQE